MLRVSLCKVRKLVYIRFWDIKRPIRKEFCVVMEKLLYFFLVQTSWLDLHVMWSLAIFISLL